MNVTKEELFHKFF